MTITGHKIASFAKLVAALADRPSLGTTALLKQWFDSSPEELRVALNGVIDDLASTTTGSSGADNIGSAPITGVAGATVYAQKVALKTLIDGLAAGTGLTDGVITSAKIADGTIVNADVSAAAAIDGSKLANLSITSAQIADGAITNVDINATAAIDATKIGAGTVSNTKYGYLGDVTSPIQAQINNLVLGSIPDGSVTLAKLSFDPATQAELDTHRANGVLDHPDGSVTNAKLADGSVTPTKLSFDPATQVELDAHRNAATLDHPNGSVTNAKVASGIDAAKIADGSVTNTKLQYINTLSSNAQTQLDTISNAKTGLNANPIINGNFDVQTQGTSITNLAGLDYLSERWLNVFINDGGTMPSTVISSIQQLNPEEIPGSLYFYRISPNGAGTGFGAQQRHCIIQFIEGATAALAGTGKKVTISFYARSSIPGKRIGVNLHQSYGTGGSPYENVYGTNWTLTSSWVKYSFTWTTNTLVGKTMMKDNCLGFQLWWVWGSYYQDRFGSATPESYGGSGNIDFAQVQVNAGDKVLPYQPKPYNEELAATKRFYQKSYSESVVPGSAVPEGSVGVMVSDNVNTKYVTPSVPFMVEMLKPPTIRIWDTAGNGGTTPKITTRDAADLSLAFNVAPAGANGGVQNIGTTGFKLKHQGAMAGISFQWDARCELPLN